jgi:hypothetical protein
MPRNWSWHVAAVAAPIEQSLDCVGSGDGIDVDTKDSGTSKMTQQGEEVDKP